MQPAPRPSPDFALVHAPLLFWWAAMWAHLYGAVTHGDHTVAYALACVGCVGLLIVWVPVVREALAALRAKNTKKMRALVSVQMIVGLLALSCWIASLVVQPSMHHMSVFAWLAAIAGSLYAGNLFVVGTLIRLEALR